MGIVQRDSLRITVISYAGAAVGYLNKIFLFTNFLDTEQVGLANLLITISVLYAQFAALGSRNIMIRFFPFFNQPEKQHNGFLVGMMAFAAAGFVITSLLFAIFQKPFALLYRDSSPLLLDYALYILPLALATVYYNLFEAYLRSLFSNIVPSVAYEIILRILVTLAISLYAIGLVSFPLFVALYVIANCMPAVVVISYTALKGWLFIKPANTKLLQRLGKIMLVYGLFSLMNNLGGFLLISVDSLMVAAMIDLSATGIYTTMIYLTSIVLIPYRSMVKVTGPLLAGLWKNRDMNKMQEVYKKAISGNLVVGAALFMLIWINLDSIFHFMPGEYAAGRFVFLLIGIGKLFEMTAGLSSTIIFTSKKYRYDMLFMAGMLVVAILGNLLLIPVFGMEGAALASMLSLLLFNVIRIVFIKYYFKIEGFSLKQVWVPLIMAAIMYMSAIIPALDSIYADVLLRSLLGVILLLVPVYLLKVSPELNMWAEGMLTQAKQLFISVISRKK